MHRAVIPCLLLSLFLVSVRGHSQKVV